MARPRKPWIIREVERALRNAQTVARRRGCPKYRAYMRDFMRQQREARKRDRGRESCDSLPPGIG